MQTVRPRQLDDPKGLLSSLLATARALPLEWHETDGANTNLVREGSLCARFAANGTGYTAYAHTERSRIVVDLVVKDPPLNPAPPITEAPQFPRVEIAYVLVKQPAPAAPISEFEAETVQDPRGYLSVKGIDKTIRFCVWRKTDMTNDDTTREGAFFSRFYSNGQHWTAYAHFAQGVFVLDAVIPDPKPKPAPPKTEAPPAPSPLMSVLSEYKPPVIPDLHKIRVPFIRDPKILLAQKGLHARDLHAATWSKVDSTLDDQTRERALCARFIANMIYWTAYAHFEQGVFTLDAIEKG